MSLTSREQERREQPGQGGPGVNERPEKSMPGRGGEAKATKESMWAASCGESRSTSETRGDWTRALRRAELLKESRPHHQPLLAAPSCLTPRRATGPGKTGRCTQVNGITSKWPLTCRSHARPEMLRPQPAGRVPAHATTPFREAPKPLSQYTPHLTMSLRCLRGQEQAKRAASTQAVTKQPLDTLPSH